MKCILFLIILFFIVFPPITAFAQSTSKVFFIDSSFDNLSRTQVASTLRYTGEHAYFFVENNFYDALSGNDLVDFNFAIKELSEEFDKTIFPKEREFFGSEWNPGIDNDSRITILVTPTKSGIGGYIRTQDEHKRSEYSSSNEREMIYLDSGSVGSALAKSYLAHEFQHLINFYQKEKLQGIAEATWLNEALSEYAPTLLGYNKIWKGSYLEKRVQDFLNLPPDSLIHWNGASSDSASVALFAHYLTGRYGENILKGILGSEFIGIEAVNSSLDSYGKDFYGVFTDWGIANYLNNITQKDGSRYAYNQTILFYGNFHTSPRAIFNVIGGQKTSGTFAIGDWQTDYYKIGPAVLGSTGVNTLKLTFDGQDKLSHFAVSYITIDFSGRNDVWHINLDSSQNSVLTIPGFGTDIASVTLVVSSQLDTSAKDRLFKQFSIQAELMEDIMPIYPDGSLLRATGDTKVYVVKGDFKRWLQSPEIFNGYGHLKWENIIEVSPAVLSRYQESFLVLRDGDYKVYEVDSAGVKRWLNMTAEKFETSGRKWDQVYIINENEFKWFRVGEDIAG